ncbi:MAG: c-type cytochrome domain-containing protein, partial [Pirellulaceae bacterium]
MEFNRDIRPILAAACLKCHGQDAGHRQADLRLDDPASATAARESGVVVAAGDPAASLLWQRIHSSDPELVMPPPDSVRQLSGEEKEKIKQWIEQGGNFQYHWAFEPISKQETRDPGVSLTQQIDHWIQEEADKRGLPVLGLADPR